MIAINRTLFRFLIRMLVSDLGCEVSIAFAHGAFALVIILEHDTGIVASPMYHSIALIPPPVLFGPLLVLFLFQVAGLVFRNREMRCFGAALACILWLGMAIKSLLLGTTAIAFIFPMAYVAGRSMALLYFPRGPVAK